MKFYLKYDTRAKVQLSDGRTYQFPDFGNNWGGLATSNEFLIREFDANIAAQRGGLSSVSEAEFNDVKKKASLKNLREEVPYGLLRTVSRLQRARQSPAVRVGDSLVSEWQAVRNASADGQRPEFESKTPAETFLAQRKNAYRPRVAAR